MKRYAYFCLLLLLMAAQACKSARPVIRMNAMTENKEWLGGQEQVFSRKNGIELKANFLKSTHKYLIYEVTVGNYSDETFMLSPDGFYYNAFDENRKALHPFKQEAENPEERLLYLDKKLAHGSAKVKNSMNQELVFLGLDVAFELTLADEIREERLRNLKQKPSNHPKKPSLSNAPLSTKMLALQDARKYWAQEALRRTTLKPGYQVSGLVFFPRSDNARYLELNFRINDTSFQWPFEQRVFE